MIILRTTIYLNIIFGPKDDGIQIGCTATIYYSDSNLVDAVKKYYIKAHQQKPCKGDGGVDGIFL